MLMLKEKIKGQDIYAHTHIEGEREREKVNSLLAE